MPTEKEHVKKADGNATFALSIKLDNQAQIDWALVILFYAALHYVEAYLAKAFNIHLQSHQTRDMWVGRDSHLRKIFIEYQDLKSFGYTARYKISKVQSNRRYG